MSQQQQTISKFTTRLSIPTSAYYQLHILLHEKDEPSRDMLTIALERIIEQSGNESLRKALNNAKNGSGDISFGKSEKNKQNRTLNASDLYQSLYLEDALKAFSKSIAEIRQRSGYVNPTAKMYWERTEINLILGNYAEALSLAQKGKISDMAFVAAISNGDFEIAKDYLEANIQNVISGQQSRNTIVTKYELIHLIVFVLFATSSTTETKRLTDKMFAKTDFTVSELKGWINDFCQRDFTKFLKNLPAMKKIFNFSIYTCPVVEQLTNAIIQNTVLLYLYPLARAPINSLCADLSISTPNAVNFIQNSIRNGKLKGKLDLTTNTYNGTIIINNDNDEMKQNFNQLLLIRKNFDINLWIREYNATVRKK